MIKRGSLFIEVLISILIFLVGILILMAVMTLSLKIINNSKDTIRADQNLINIIDNYMLMRVFTNSGTPSGPFVEKVISSQEIDIQGFVLRYSLYRYQRSGKTSVYFDVLQREE